MATVTAYPTANTAASGFNGSWTNPNNAHGDDAVYATVANIGRNKEHANYWHGFDFSSIPAGSTINSVTVAVEHKLSTTGSIATLNSSAWADHAAGSATTQIGTTYSDAAEPTVDTIRTYTIPATLSQLQASGFAVRVQSAQGNTNTGYTHSLDFVRVTVDYTAPTSFTLTVADAAHAHTATHLTLTQQHTLTIEPAAQLHSATNLDLGIPADLVVANATHAQAADAPTLGYTDAALLGRYRTLGKEPTLATVFFEQAAVNLTVNSATHAHTAGATDVTQQHQLTVADATHGQTADGVTLAQTHVLTVQNGAHAQTADSQTLTQVHSLAVDQGAHTHTADNLGLTQQHQLAVDSGTHLHAADNVPITTATTLGIADASHGHAADEAALTQQHALTVADASHAQTADNVTLAGGISLITADASHAHAVDNVVLTENAPPAQLVVADTAHGHTAAVLIVARSEQLKALRKTTAALLACRDTTVGLAARRETTVELEGALV